MISYSYPCCGLLIVAVLAATSLSPSAALQPLQPLSATAPRPTDSRSTDSTISNNSPIVMIPPKDTATVAFSHVHLYVDHLDDLAVYKDLEAQLLQLSVKRQQQGLAGQIEPEQALWKSILNESASATTTTTTTATTEEYVPQNRDVVKQLLASLGFCVTGARYPSVPHADAKDLTRSVLVTSRDPKGVQIIVTAPDDGTTVGSHTPASDPQPHHFDASQLRMFAENHHGYQGIAVLAFTSPHVDRIHANYQRLHPALVAHYQVYGNVKVLEVYAYYQYHDEDSKAGDRVADKGTILRFIQDDRAPSTPLLACPLPGLVPVEATFADDTQAAYCDHWVSNVFARTEFLDTLHETLGFTPKVDFNAGVVAAGEAQIESTVTGNDSTLATTDAVLALQDQSQVYLPINNALSSVGHVHGFLQQIGQGVQHVASRVENLVEFVQRANDYRQITNEGFTFLRIPRSYYGVLSLDMLTEGIVGDGSDALTDACAQELLEGLVRRGTLTKEGALDLDLTRVELDKVVQDTLSGASLVEYQERREGVLDIMMRSRYKNLYALLRDSVSETTYLGIVRNQILVDIQGEDLLYQIFTSNILQRQAGQEAPFFEFIQRVCSECIDEATGCPQKIRPGCGGFGIRNFLTLFLSIEVSKAMQDVTDALLEGDVERQAYAQSMVDCFTEQLNESNPILTQISDAMTLEGQLKEEMVQAMMDQDHDAIALIERKMTDASAQKQRGNEALMACSTRYNDRMKALREQREKSQQQ